MQVITKEIFEIVNNYHSVKKFLSDNEDVIDSDVLARAETELGVMRYEAIVAMTANYTIDEYMDDSDGSAD